MRCKTEIHRIMLWDSGQVGVEGDEKLTMDPGNVLYSDYRTWPYSVSSVSD
jgi:hypothetical protein